jgi:hypothetical protein
VNRPTFLGGLAGGLLATRPGPIEADIRFVTVVLGLSAVVVFLVCTGILALVSSRRRTRKLAKIGVAVVAGLMCGALWILLVAIVVNASMPGVMNEPAVLIFGAVTAALVAAGLLPTSYRLHKVLGLSAMVIGFHALALPLAALFAFVVRGRAMVSCCECPTGTHGSDSEDQAHRRPAHCGPERRRTTLGCLLGLRRGSSSQTPQEKEFTRTI